ncbi:MAG: hypothetical protein GY849_03390 [Deltaproteobacteria bacterium]|nr:hypothetical protein [Deltaproteobacteria bacterium]
MENFLDSRFVEKSESIVTQLGFKDLKSFVKNQALLMVMARMEKYEAEDKHFEAKYRMDFRKFQKKIEGIENKEVFAEEDDYLDWRFANEALDRLRRQKLELEHA